MKYSKTEIEKKEYTNKLRLMILENSLFHEHLITYFLGTLLEIETEGSYSLSDKSSALSLASKINLLIDLKSLNREQKPKLSYYLEIRNQFLHNWKCTTFEDCFKSLDKTYNGLKKLYSPDIKLTLEEQMNFCYDCLSNDIVDIATNDLMKNIVKVKTTQKKLKRESENFKEMTPKVIKSVWELMDSSELSKYNITIEDKMKLMGEFMNKII